MNPTNYKLLSINIFLVVLTIVSNSPYRLKVDLIEIESVIRPLNNLFPYVTDLLIFVISSFVILKFVLSYISLAAYIVAFYPIINGDLIELLIPTIILQLIQNILLHGIEFVCGIFVCYNYIPKAKVPCQFFYIKMITKLMLGIYIMNIYGNYYNKLKYRAIQKMRKAILDELPNKKLKYIANGCWQCRGKNTLILCSNPAKSPAKKRHG